VYVIVFAAFVAYRELDDVALHHVYRTASSPALPMPPVRGAVSLGGE